MTQCNRCHLQYIAETKRCLKGRFNELRFSVHKANIKVTLYLQWCLAHKRCSAPGLNCRYLKPYMKLKFVALAIKLNYTNTFEEK